MPWCAGLTREGFATLPLGVRIRCAIADLVGFRYGTGNEVTFPAARPGIPSGLVASGRRLIDCSSATAYVVITATPRGRWDAARYRDLQIMDPRRAWSPIEAIEQAGVGSRISAPVPGVWALCQAWGDASLDDGDGVKDGHSRLVFVRPDGDTLDVFESTTQDGRIGPRWTTTSYARLTERYPAGVRLAALGPG